MLDKTNALPVMQIIPAPTGSMLFGCDYASLQQSLKVASSPKIDPVDVRESYRAGGPERIFSDVSKTLWY